MAENDIKIIAYPGQTMKFPAEDRTVSTQSYTMKPGEPVKMAGTGNNFAYLLATGDPEIGTDNLLGIVAKESTETATVDGYIEVQLVIPGLTVMEGKATTSTNINTQAKLDALIFDQVTFDLTTVYFTIDEDEGTDPNSHGLVILGGDIEKFTLKVALHANASIFGSLIGQTID
jgi:hypothetical protein